MMPQTVRSSDTSYSPHRMGEGRLRIEIHHQDAIPVERGRMRHMQCDGGFARAAFEVGDRDTDRALVRGALGHQRGAVHLHLPAQLVDLLQREPTLATVFLHLTARKIRIGGKAATEGRLIDLEDQLRDFPAREAAQRLLMLGREGLAADESLHLERLRLQGCEVLMGKHARFRFF